MGLSWPEFTLGKGLLAEGLEIGRSAVAEDGDILVEGGGPDVGDGDEEGEWAENQAGGLDGDLSEGEFGESRERPDWGIEEEELGAENGGENGLGAFHEKPEQGEEERGFEKAVGGIGGFAEVCEEKE